MGKVIRILFIVAVVFLGITFWFQWRIYNQKADLRSDALLYFKEEDYAKAIEYFEEALAKRTVFGRAMDRDMKCYLAESRYRMKEYEEAEELYRKLQQEDPDEALYYIMEGQCAAAAGDDKRALKIFQKGWEKTKEVSCISGICEIYIRHKKYARALEYARQGIGEEGTASAELMYELIIIYEKSQDYKAAYDAAKEYTKMYPDDEKGKKELIFLSSRV